MKTLTITIARPDTGAVLPLASVAVYQSDGATRATIFKADGTAQSNPIKADQNGSITIRAADGTYVLSAVSADGSLTVPPIRIDFYDLPAIQDAAAASAAAAANSAAQALQAATAAQGTVHTLTTAVSAGGTLPFEVSALSGSFVGTGTGGTPGEYALVVSGGPAGHTAFITVGSDGKIASARIGARGIATANTAPTYALPSGTGLTGATLPTPTVTSIAAGRIFLAPNTSTGATLLLGWIASGGVIAAWTVGGSQWAQYLKGGIDAFGIASNPAFSIIGTTPDGYSFRYAMAGSNGKAVAGLDTSMRWVAAGGFYAPPGKGITLGNSVIADADNNYAWAVVGRTGKPLVGLGRFDQTWYVQNLNVAQLFTLNGVDVAATISAASLASSDTANVARGRAVSETPHNRRVVRIGDKANNLIVGLGQSLMSGQEGWPYLPRTAEARTFMMGSSVRPSTFDQPGFTPQGSAVLTALASTVEAQTNTSRAPLSDSAIAALATGNGAEGETILTGAVRQLARGYADQRGDMTPAFIAANAAVAGRTIEALSKGASPNIYTRGTAALTALAGIVDPGGSLNNYQVAAAIIAQGEWNYNSAYGGTQDYATYLNLLRQLRNDYNTDWAAVSGQTVPPAWLTYVTSGAYVIDSVNMAISNAQVDFALTTPGVWCFGPAYPVNDKGGHLQPNGYRWMGAMAGKVLRKVLVERLGFEPLTPVRITSAGTNVYVHFATASPLQFQPCYVGSGTSITPTTYSAYGFRVSDDAGSPTITNVSIVGSSIVQISLSRALSTNPFVWYASAATGGNGNLCNSDPTVSDDVFTFLTSLPGNAGGSGMYASENIAALVNNPYPLWDWCVPFRRPVGYSR